MIARLMTTVALVGAVGLMPAGRADADAGDFIAGAAVGVLGTLAVQEANKTRPRQSTKTVRRAPSARIPVTEQGRQTQTALNYFGYNAGTVDGQIGGGTRAAIERYQVSMGYPVNGRDFQPYQFDMLSSAYSWAQNGGQVQTGLYGQQLLMAYRNQYAGGGQTPALAAAPTTAPTLGGQPALGGGQTTLAAAGTAAPPLLGGAPAAAQAAPSLQAAPAPVETAAAAAPAATTGLPNFMATGEAKSLASHCNTVSLLTGSNGGFTTAATVTDADFALSEQFCLARTYAIETGQDLAASVQGVSATQIEAQCGAFGTALSTQVASLGVKDRDAVLQDVAGFVLNSGLEPVELAGTARICLGVGYRTDDMSVALGTGLILAALGERAYGELMGHHLSQGFGATKNAERARPWYEMGIEAAEAEALFAPGQPERVEVIKVAVSGEAPAPVPAAGDGQGLVLFKVAE